MGALSVAITRGEELYEIVAGRFLDANLFEETLDICKDLFTTDNVSYDEVSCIERVAEIFNEEMSDVIHQFGEMAGFEYDEILYAWDKWTQENSSQLSGMVAQILFKNQKFCQLRLPSERMNVIAPNQNEIFPQFREAAMTKTGRYEIWQ